MFVAGEQAVSREDIALVADVLDGGAHGEVRSRHHPATVLHSSRISTGHNCSTKHTQGLYLESVISLPSWCIDKSLYPFPEPGNTNPQGCRFKTLASRLHLPAGFHKPNSGHSRKEGSMLMTTLWVNHFGHCSIDCCHCLKERGSEPRSPNPNLLISTAWLLGWKKDQKKRRVQRSCDCMCVVFCTFVYVCVCMSMFHLFHSWADPHSRSSPTGTWATRCQPAGTPGSTGMSPRCRGPARGGTCFSSHWWSLGAQDTCRYEEPLWPRQGGRKGAREGREGDQ